MDKIHCFRVDGERDVRHGFQSGNSDVGSVADNAHWDQRP